jgi:hypothetical protein
MQQYLARLADLLARHQHERLELLTRLATEAAEAGFDESELADLEAEIGERLAAQPMALTEAFATAYAIAGERAATMAEEHDEELEIAEEADESEA